MRRLAALAVLILLAAGPKGFAMSAHDFEFTAIDGSALPLTRYKGKAVLVVNTASQCGFTPQYDGLQALWERYRDRGLVVLGVPSNDFGRQEPGSNAEIQTFCTVNFRVDFPLTEKQAVIGPNAHPFYRWVTQELGEGAAPRWNFHKYLIGPNGRLSGAFPSRVEPLSDELVRAVETALPKAN